VWNIAWLKGQPSPLHRHVYDLVGVYYEPGDRMIISPEGAKRPVSTQAWNIAFQRAGLTHIEEGTSDAPLRSVFIEMKRPGTYGTSGGAGDAPAFAGDGATQKLDNDRVTVWEYTQPPAGSATRTCTTPSSSPSTAGPRARCGCPAERCTPPRTPDRRRVSTSSSSSNEEAHARTGNRNREP